MFFDENLQYKILSIDCILQTVHRLIELLSRWTSQSRGFQTSEGLWLIILIPPNNLRASFSPTVYDGR